MPRLIVGPLNSANRLEDARRAWERLTAAVPNPIPGYRPTFQNHVSRARDGGRAQVIPDLGPGFEDNERIWIVMGAGFFASPEAEQVLTLIHETCHARLYLGPLRHRAIETMQLQRTEQARRDQAWQHRARRDHVADLCANDKYDTAFQFRTHNEEILAERLLAELHPGLAQQRVQMYRTLREGFQARGGVGVMIPELQCYGLLYEIARNDLGASLSATDDDRDTFNRMATQRVTELRQFANADQLLAFRVGLQEPEIPPPPALSAFDQLWDEVMAVPIAPRRGNQLSNRSRRASTRSIGV